jgi:hypothetical protein
MLSPAAFLGKFAATYCVFILPIKGRKFFLRCGHSKVCHCSESWESLGVCLIQDPWPWLSPVGGTILGSSGNFRKWGLAAGSR